MSDEKYDASGQAEPIAEVKSARARTFLRLFLMAAGGLAAPCLALAAFFLANSGGGDAPVKSAVVQGGQITTTTGRAAPVTPVAPVATTTTTLPSSPVSPPPRDPFQPLITQPPAGGTPAR